MSEIREISFPFNAVESDGVADRVYDAEDFARYWGAILTTGVHMDNATALKVDAVADSAAVMVRPGTANIHGYGHALLDDMPVAVSAAHAVYVRKDAVVLRLNLTDRWIKVLYREGEAAASPLLPELVRTADIYDLRLAEITVRAGVQTITPADILDTRLDGDVCGRVAVRPLHVDTTDIFNQYQNYLNQQIAAWDQAKAQQAADWQSQMTQQSTDWQTAMDGRTTQIDAWYAEIKADISARQSVSYEDIAQMPGVTANTAFNATCSITDTASVSATGRVLAVRETVFLEDGSITETVTVYEEDGETVLRTQTKTTAFNSDGSITEVIE